MSQKRTTKQAKVSEKMDVGFLVYREFEAL
jgi:hypothetical protein